MMDPISQRFIPIVLCAGFGTRLSPLTKFIPKVACPIVNKPLSFLNIEQLFQAGFEKVHCNIHYLADTVKAELIAATSYFGYDPRRIVFWEEKDILETGGGIARIYHELCSQDVSNKTKDLLVVSGDIVAQFPIAEMVNAWRNKETDTLALMGTRKLMQDRTDVTWISQDRRHVIGFGAAYAAVAKQQHAEKRLFSNHQIISHHLVKHCPVEKKPSVPLFFQAALDQGLKILHHEIPETEHWFNVGTVPEYLDCISFFYHSNKANEHVVNYAHHTPPALRLKIDECMAKMAFTKDLPPKDSVIIAFHDSHKKGDCFLSMKDLEPSMDQASHFYLCV